MSKLSTVFSTGFDTGFAVFLAAFWALPALAVSANDDTADAAGVSPQQAAAELSVPSMWPLQMTDNGRTFLIHHPQIDKWENNRLEGRSAVSVRNDGSGQQTFGVIYFSAHTELDQASHKVTVRDAVVGKVDFPTAPNDAENYLSILRPQLASRSWQVAQDKLQSDMEIDRLAERASQQPLKNDPPRILYSERPSVLVPIDGNPVLRPVADTGLRRVANTRALILQDTGASRYYLFVSSQWMAATSLDGPWSVAANPSPQLEQARQIAMQQDQVDLLQPEAGDAAPAPARITVFVSTTPTELLQTDGPAQYAPIERTQLLYVTNSPNKLFLDLRTQNHYALISGRWYRTPALTEGPWSYVAAASLPADFAMIPDEHPTESVRAAVPGTPQAREAVIANTVPQMATVTRNAAHLEVAYDGNPVFQPIEGTVLQNAVNSPVPVIRVDEDSFYALDNGVWFVASSPFGPWAAATYVPPVIYSIPRSSPLYYVTYVRVYDSTPQAVYVGYTPGYVGSYVSSDNVVVYGSGWPYTPWIGSVWYGAPITWGFGFSFCYSWWHPYPWHSWHRAAWPAPRPYYRPSWGPWHAPLYARARPGFSGGAHGFAPGGGHHVDRIYDRWDRRSVGWNGTGTAAHPQRRDAPGYSRAMPGNSRDQRFQNEHFQHPGSVAGSDSRWRQSGNDGMRDRSRRDVQQQVHGNGANSPGAGTPPAAQTPPAVQTWRRAQSANQPDRARQQSAPQRVQPPSFGGNERRAADNRPFSPGLRTDAASAPADRARPNAPQHRPVQSPRMPPVAGVPVERAPLPSQRAQPQWRNASPPAVRIERPVVSNTGRGIERPTVNSGRALERSAAPQVRGNAGRGQWNPGGGQGRGQSNSSGGGGEGHGGGNHR